MRWAVGVISVVVVVLLVSIGGIARAKETTKHPMEMRPVLAHVRTVEGSRAPSAAERTAIRSCSRSQIAAASVWPVSRAADLDPSACVVVRDRESSSAGVFAGPAIVTARDVQTVTAERGPDGWVVNFGLTTNGLKRLNRHTANAFAYPTPMNEIAIVVDGGVASSPVVQAPEYAGEIQISGDFTSTEARAIARRIRAAGGG